MSLLEPTQNGYNCYLLIQFKEDAPRVTLELWPPLVRRRLSEHGWFNVILSMSDIASKRFYKNSEIWISDLNQRIHYLDVALEHVAFTTSVLVFMGQKNCLWIFYMFWQVFETSLCVSTTVATITIVVKIWNETIISNRSINEKNNPCCVFSWKWLQYELH